MEKRPLSNLAAPGSSLSPSSPGTSFPSNVGSQFYLVKLLISCLSPEDADSCTLWETQSLNISFYMLKKKNQDPRSSGNELNSQAVFILVVRSHIPGVSMHHRFIDHTASSERSYFWFFGWYQIYEKCFCFPQIRVQEIKTSSRQV